MQATTATSTSRSAHRLRTWIGVLALVAGLLGHLLSAQAIGGHYVAYRDHIFGFVLIAAVTAPIIALLGGRFWKGRIDVTLLTFGLLQAAFGFAVWLNRYNLRYH